MDKKISFRQTTSFWGEILRSNQDGATTKQLGQIDLAIVPSIVLPSSHFGQTKDFRIKAILTASEKMSECIYKFVEQPQQKKAKKKTYRSKYDPNGPLIGSTFCMQGTTAVDGKGFHSLKKVGPFLMIIEVPAQYHLTCPYYF